MLYDILIPSRIDTYFLLKKKVLSIEINPCMLKAVLIEYSGTLKIIKQSQTIILKDFTIQAQVTALKKIISAMGSYDELITLLPSSHVVYKELTLPFIGYDTLAMIVPFEVEPLLPFTIQEAVTDFIIMHENSATKESNILVAAIRTQDLQEFITLFEKADIKINNITIDIFALYETLKMLEHKNVDPKKTIAAPKEDSSYSIRNLWTALHHKIKGSKNENPAVVPSPNEPSPSLAKNATLYADIGYDVTRILYFHDGSLIAMRMLPLGINDMILNIANNQSQSYFDLMQNVLHNQINPDLEKLLHSELNTFFEDIKRTIVFFEKQYSKIFIYPSHFWFSGFLTDHSLFLEIATNKINHSVGICKSQKIIESIQIQNKAPQNHLSILNISTALFEYFNQTVNFLKNSAQTNQNSLLNKQLISILLITVLSIAATFWKSTSILSHKESAYNASKKQCIQEIQHRMHLDLHGEKNIKVIVEKTEEKLKKDQNLWMLFTKKQEHSILEYLQDLSINIDRESTGLIIKNMHFDYDTITMNGSVKTFEKLDILEEELMELQTLNLIEKPRELTFSLIFKPKMSQGKKS